MIGITSFAEKKQPSFAVFRAKHSLRRFTPALRDGGPLLFLSTGAEAPAYYQSASPRRRRFYLPAIHPASRVTVVSVLKTLNRNVTGGPSPIPRQPQCLHFALRWPSCSESLLLITVNALAELSSDPA